MRDAQDQRLAAANASLVAKLSREQLVQLVGTCDRSLAHLPQLRAPLPGFEPTGLDLAGLRRLRRRRLERLLLERLAAVVELVRDQAASGDVEASAESLFEAARSGALELGLAHRQVIFELQSLLPFWNGGATRSGAGSTLEATVAIRAALPPLLARHQVDSLLDAPCGDFHWARALDLGEIRYIGVDIVADIIAANRAQFSAPGIIFERADIVHDQLPSAAAILCRDCLFHLNVEDVRRTLENFKRTGARLLVTTTFPHLQANRSIPTGYFHPINLQIAPYHLPPSLELVADEPPSKYLGVWRLEDLPSFAS